MPRSLKHARSLARRARSSTPVLVAVVAVVALGLGSVSYAAGLVTGRDVKNSSLTGRDVKDRSLTGRDVKNKSLTRKDIKTDSLTGAQVRDGSLTGRDLATGTITTSHLAPGVSVSGPTGPTGPTGARGQDGSQGPQGPTGADGDDGADGAQGPSGTSAAYAASGDAVPVTTSATTVAQVQVPAGSYVISAGTMATNLGLLTTATCTLSADGSPIAGGGVDAVLALGGVTGATTTFSFGDVETFAAATTLRLACLGTGVSLSLRADSGFVTAIKVDAVNPAP